MFNEVCESCILHNRFLMETTILRRLRVKLFLVVAFLSGNSSVILANDESLSHQYERVKRECHDLSCIRTEMDRINNDILRLLTERTAYVKRAGDLKSRTTRVADDRLRVADQEQKIIAKSLELELPVEISIPAFRMIMENSIQFQQGYINQLSCETP